MPESNAGIPPHHIAAGAPPAAANSHASRSPQPAARTAPAARTRAAAKEEPKDSLREVIETVVFVVVLVLLLKSFVAEAFVIPTGSMAETLYGYQKLVVCPQCHYKFPVNCSSEVDPQQGPPTPVAGCICPNCRYVMDFSERFNPPWHSGDRVLVGKYLYDLDLAGLNHPNRYDVVVFKYPREPQRDYTPLNYIKRLIGLPGETIAINYGDLHVYDGLSYQDVDRDVPRKDLWEKAYTHLDDPQAAELFHAGKFHILRKAPKHILAEMRLVYDNDYQAQDLIGNGNIQPRWGSEPAQGGWTPDKTEEPKVFQHDATSESGIDWLRYRHLIPDDERQHARTELITDFMGYNTWQPPHDRREILHLPPQNWVPDLILESTVEVRQPQGQFVLELSKGVDRFRARFDLTNGQCTLTRVHDGREENLQTADTGFKGTGTHRIRFANVDERLTVWVDSSLPFGDGVAYDPPRQRGPTAENDLQPASVGVQGAGITLSHVRLLRDTYYTVNVDRPAADADARVDYSQPSTWDALQNLPVLTMYVQPDHFLGLGDNSPESSDGRSWGLVPRRLLLGRALLIYHPFPRAGRIE